MTDQKIPPRTREEIDKATCDLIGQFVMHMRDPEKTEAAIKDFVDAHADCAELRSGAKPIYQVWYDYEGWNDMPWEDWDLCSVPHKDKRIVYLHPPVPREAELAAAAKRLRGILSELVSEFGGTLEQYERNGPDLTCADGEFIAVSAFEDRRGLLEKARAALAAAPETRG